MKKVYELKIYEDDELSGIDSISIVAEPAIEVNFLAFKKETKEFVPDGQDKKYLEALFIGGQPEQELFDDGWVIDKIEPINYEEFALAPTNPNIPSEDDTKLFRIRYKYGLKDTIKQDPIILTTREYCRTLLNKNYVWRVEELKRLNPNKDPDDGGWGGDPMIWRGGYNCRHQWWKITYKKEGKIVNKTSVNINKVLDDAGRPRETKPNWNQPDTIVAPTKNNPSPQTVKNLGLSKFATDIEKRILFGPAMIPDMKIPRIDEYGKPYEVFFSKETIKMIAEKYMKNKYIDNNDLDHDGKPRKDNFVLESWIIEDSVHDKAFKYDEFKDLPVGTWMIAMKINDDETWEKVKNHDLNGFSVSGFFDKFSKFDREEMFLQDLANLIKNWK